MKHLVILAGVAALAAAGPALADPGHGKGHGNGNGHGQDYDYGYDYHGAGCPPGLAKKHNGCLPPGQAKKLYRGQRWQTGYGTYYTYGRIPYDVRRRYDLNEHYHYYYDNGYLYAVDPRTMLVAQVITTILR